MLSLVSCILNSTEAEVGVLEYSGDNPNSTEAEVNVSGNGTWQSAIPREELISLLQSSEAYFALAGFCVRVIESKCVLRSTVTVIQDHLTLLQVKVQAN